MLSFRIRLTALSQFIAYHKWNYISVVYTDEVYGRSGFERLTENFRQDMVCVAGAYKIRANPDKDRVSFTLCSFVYKTTLFLNRLHIGHSYLTHSFILRKEEAPVCVACNAVITVKHILI